MVALPRFGFCFNLGGGEFGGDGGGGRFPPSTQDFPNHTHKPLPGFIQIEKQTNKGSHDGLPYQRSQAGVNVSQNEMFHLIPQII
jgi:hypothetical protein